MFRRNRNPFHLQTPHQAKQQAYSARFDTTQTEINALRTKVAITLGLFGVLFTIFFSYQIFSEGTLENAIFIILICSAVIVGLNYFLTYMQLHRIKHTIYPTDSAMNMIAGEKSTSKIEKILSDDLKVVCEKLSLDQSFYSQIIQALDLFFIFSLIISFAGYIIFNNSNVDVTLPEAAYSRLLIIFIFIEFTVMISLIYSMILGMRGNFKRIVVQTDGIIRFVMIFGSSILLFYSPYIFIPLSLIIADGSFLQTLSIIIYVVLVAIIFRSLVKETIKFAKDVSLTVDEFKKEKISSVFEDRNEN